MAGCVCPPADRTSAVFALALFSMLFVAATEVADGDYDILLVLPVSLSGFVIIYRWWRARSAG